MGRLDHKGKPELRVLPDRPDQQERQVQLVRQVQLEQQVHQIHRLYQTNSMYANTEWNHHCTMLMVVRRV